MAMRLMSLCSTQSARRPSARSSTAACVVPRCFTVAVSQRWMPSCCP